MSEYTATICWENRQAKFTDNRYSREHTWKFDGGVEIPASSSPHVVPVPYSNPNCIDPEEAFIAALSSCHMLWFLSIAAQNKFVVKSYSDRAIGIMDKNDYGNLAMTTVRLFPKVVFTGNHLPTEEQIENMHDQAHHACFLANSVKTHITITSIPA
ncbi:peroxiredoxin [Pseudanabaena sp. SR411]|uniref:OsmC family protein n=1 Tax=Pseudanabaena sp. SR411 TaxID=1980935 RepID=UPI000B988C70|nr:OsmC family protein [Pseudanabaena sp. SR411]OYQ63659.1 peroxiredoxin [Pseudanabaena sp. SR411]